MTDQIYNFTYDFHPVGQGLFASGFLSHNTKDEPFFRWVYDCGTSSSQNLVDSAISSLDHFQDHRKRLDLVILSHFDHDHISGICQLAGKFEIGTLMLPYMALEQRLWMAFEEDVRPGDDLMGFFVNPTEYLSGLEGSRIRNILYVPPSGDEGPPEQLGEPSNEPGPNEENGVLMQIDVDEAPSVDDFAATSTNSQVNVQFLKLGGTARLQGFWEFVPYNDDPAKDIPDGFREIVQSARDKLVQGASHDKREQALKDLKELYQKQFGKSSEKRNIISLFLLAGPVYAAWSKASNFGFYCYDQYDREFENVIHREYGDCVRKVYYRARPDRSWKPSILYTGDGYMDNYERLVRLTKFFGHERVGRVGVMQVMHHGSETNWHKGVATTFKPFFSVFSSDPDCKKWGHPHGAVLRDFWSFGPLQVDKSKYVSIKGYVGSRYF